jgi:hypothetical protein
MYVSFGALLSCADDEQFLHHYERYAWLVMTTLFIIVYALGGHAGTLVYVMLSIVLFVLRGHDPQVRATSWVTIIFLSFSLSSRCCLPFMSLNVCSLPNLQFRLPDFAASPPGGPSRTSPCSRCIKLRWHYVLIVRWMGSSVRVVPTGRCLIIDLLAFRAADFNCRLPVNTRPAKVFMLTFLGVFLPVTFIVTLGAVLMTVPTYVEAYVNGDAAGVLGKGEVCYLR